mmetsp:Transcript_10681/g.25479  ORF Transcript_10681/g.25479 Transcript_10681/m.25479 type:complete len:494 (-) Transcript_10681:830-2311(-)
MRHQNKLDSESGNGRKVHPTKLPSDDYMYARSSISRPRAPTSSQQQNERQHRRLRLLQVSRFISTGIFVALIGNSLRLSGRSAILLSVCHDGGSSSFDEPLSANDSGNISTDIEPGIDLALVRKELLFHVITREDSIDNLMADCGGCTVLWSLKDALESHKFEVTTFSCPSMELKRRAHAQNRTIVVVYPEVDDFSCDNSVDIGDFNERSINETIIDHTTGTATTNNETTVVTAAAHPLRHNTRVRVDMVHVRWMLAPVGLNSPFNITDSWGQDDVIFNYATSTGPNIPVSNVLQVVENPKPGDATDISMETFYSKTNRTDKIAWMMRKGDLIYNASTLQYIHNRSAFNITELTRGNKDPSILRDYEYFVTYDPYTYWSWFAAMLGTVSVVYPRPNFTKTEWAESTFLGSYLQATGGTDIPGVAYGWYDDEIDYARRTMQELRGFLLKVKEWGVNVTVPRFTRDCYRFRYGERQSFESALLKRYVYPSYPTTP